MAVNFETAERLAREALQPGSVGVSAPCGCCRRIFAHGSAWGVDGCDCNNSGDLMEAQSWCTTENAVARVRALIERIT